MEPLKRLAGCIVSIRQEKAANLRHGVPLHQRRPPCHIFFLVEFRGLVCPNRRPDPADMRPSDGTGTACVLSHAQVAFGSTTSDRRPSPHLIIARHDLVVMGAHDRDHAVGRRAAPIEVLCHDLIISPSRDFIISVSHHRAISTSRHLTIA